jgi:4-hydroxy-3-methylbut-2-enyl diphosphate reductase
MTRRPLKVLMAAPRGFCAGVVRAIEIVERALERYGSPVYVRHEIVHNRHVVDELKRKGAVFVEELDEVPDGDRPVVFSAHGVPRVVTQEAGRRRLLQINATCPLVTKVHVEAKRHHAEGRDVLLIGHRGHPEVEGTMGQLPEGAILLVESIGDAEKVAPKRPDRLAYVTQTTLSLDDTRSIVEILKRRFPAISGPAKDDICYATANRQEALKAIAPLCDLVLVVGAPNSSNSKRLVEVAINSGCRHAVLVQDAREIDWPMLDRIETLGLSAGASAPEVLVEEILAALRERFDVRLETATLREEAMSFKLPRSVREIKPAA